MIIPNAEYMEGVCAWLDGNNMNPYEDDVLDPRVYDWYAGWSYANVNYGIKQYGKV